MREREARSLRKLTVGVREEVQAENCVPCTAVQERGAAEEQSDRGQGCARER